MTYAVSTHFDITCRFLDDKTSNSEMRRQFQNKFTDFSDTLLLEFYILTHDGFSSHYTIL